MLFLAFLFALCLPLVPGNPWDPAGLCDGADRQWVKEGDNWGPKPYDETFLDASNYKWFVEDNCTGAWIFLGETNRYPNGSWKNTTCPKHTTCNHFYGFHGTEEKHTGCYRVDVRHHNGTLESRSVMFRVGDPKPPKCEHVHIVPEGGKLKIRILDGGGWTVMWFRMSAYDGSFPIQVGIGKNSQCSVLSAGYRARMPLCDTTLEVDRIRPNDQGLWQARAYKATPHGNSTANFNFSVFVRSPRPVIQPISLRNQIWGLQCLDAQNPLNPAHMKIRPNAPTGNLVYNLTDDSVSVGTICPDYPAGLSLQCCVIWGKSHLKCTDWVNLIINKCQYGTQCDSMGSVFSLQPFEQCVQKGSNKWLLNGCVGRSLTFKSDLPGNWTSDGSWGARQCYNTDYLIPLAEDGIVLSPQVSILENTLTVSAVEVGMKGFIRSYMKGKLTLQELNPVRKPKVVLELRAVYRDEIVLKCSRSTDDKSQVITWLHSGKGYDVTVYGQIAVIGFKCPNVLLQIACRVDSESWVAQSSAFSIGSNNFKDCESQGQPKLTFFEEGCMNIIHKTTDGVTTCSKDGSNCGSIWAYYNSFE